MKILNRAILHFVLAIAVISVSMAVGAASLAAKPGAVGAAPVPLRAMGIDGKVYDLANEPTAKATALVFVATQCPISNKYVPELNRLAALQPTGVRLFAVISDPTVTRAAAAQYVKDYQISFPVLFDASGELARRLLPKVTPEALVLDAAGAVQYRGRIDDTWGDLRKQKVAASTHDLADALASVAAGKTPLVTKTDVVGCVFEAWADHGAPAKVTYARDVAPVLNANCVKCHREGEVAPFSLTSYEGAAKHARQLARVTDDRTMPPWKAEPGFGHFADERRLSDDETHVLTAWAASGAAKGDDADLPPTPKFPAGWSLGEPDVVLTMPQPFEVPASGRDVYRVFPMPMNLPADKYVVAYEFKPGATAVVHHALFFLDDKGEGRRLAAANADGQPGYRVFGGVGFQPSAGIGGWAPGVTPYFLPDGVGRPVHKAADLVMQVHYHPDGKPHADQSKLALYFATKPIERATLSWPLMNRQIDIPAGDAHYVRTATIIAPTDVTLIGVTPHMHLVGKQMKVTATKPDGTVVPLVWIKDWDFRWQDQYRFAEPVKLPAGTKVELEAIYDNSTANPDNPNTPPQRVTRGEQTTNEMCICFLQLTMDQLTLPARRPAADAGAAPGRAGLLRRLLGGGPTKSEPAQ